MKRILALLLILGFPLHALCSEGQAENAASAATVPDTIDNEFPLFDEADIIEVYDPFELINRGFFWFNDKLYFFLMKPVARAWR
jgi:phospholipid-binding lipoprotein MlaA